MITIKQATGFARRLTFLQIQSHNINLGCVGFYQILGTNKYIAIRTKNRFIDLASISEVRVLNEVEEPIYKQHMRMQMGMKPRKIQQYSVYLVRPLSDSEIPNKYFELYDII